jgi:hypothetical protein
MKAPFKKPGKALIQRLVVTILVTTSLALAGYFYYLYQQTNAKANEVESTIEDISRHIKLPEGEVPTLATVADKKKLSEQEFFKLAENGDKVLIYKQAQKAILYRPSIDRIIDIAPVRSTEGEGTVRPTPAPTTITTRTSVMLLNGTTTTGVTNSIEESLKKQFSESLNIVEKDNAQRDNYAETLVIVLNNEKREQGVEIARHLAGRITELPEGEIRPDVDILVIIGQAQQDTPTPSPTQ